MKQRAKKRRLNARVIGEIRLAALVERLKVSTREASKALDEAMAAIRSK